MTDDRTIFLAVFVIGMLVLAIWLAKTNSHGQWKWREWKKRGQQ